MADEKAVNISEAGGMARNTEANSTESITDKISSGISATPADKSISTSSILENTPLSAGEEFAKREDPDIYFRQLLQHSFDHMFDKDGKRVDNASGYEWLPLTRTELDSVISSFVNWAATTPEIVDSFFLPKRDKKTAHSIASAVKDKVKRLAKRTVKRAKKPVAAADITQPAPATDGSATATNAAEQARPSLVEPAADTPEEEPQDMAESDIAAELEKLIMDIYEEAGQPGIEALRREIAKQPSILPLFDGLVQKQGISPNIADAPIAPFSGSYEEVALQGTMALRQHSMDARYLYALRIAVGPLAEAVQRFEDAGYSPERQVDLLVHLFAGEPVYRRGRPSCNDQFREFMARLRALLASQTEGRDALGFMETQVNLITWYGSSQKDPQKERCLACGVELGLELLRRMVATTSTAGGKNAQAARMLERTANSLAGWLDDLMVHRGDEEKMAKGPGAQLNALHALATVASLWQESGVAWDEPASKLLTALGCRAEIANAGGMARAFLFMANIPPAWRFLSPLFSPQDIPDLSPRYRTAVLAFISAVMRARFNTHKDADDIPAALFNVGVDVTLLTRSTGGLSRGVRLRILANGLGLWWALSRARDEGSVVGRLHGGDCTVNLFGALTDLASDDLIPILKQVRALGDALHSRLEENDRFRLENSYREILETQPSKAVLNLAETAASVADMLQSLIARWTNDKLLIADLPKMIESDFASVAAQCLSWAFRHLDKDISHSAYDRTIEMWIQVANRLIEISQSGDQYNFWKDDIIPVDPSAWGLVESAKCDGVDYKSIAVGPHFLSETLRDRELMQGVFGLSKDSPMRNQLQLMAPSS